MDKRYSSQVNLLNVKDARMRTCLIVIVAVVTLASNSFAQQNDCSDRWHREWIQNFNAIPRDSWECYRIDRDNMTEGRYAERWGLGGNGNIEVYYNDAELYANWVWYRNNWGAYFDTEFRASFWGRNWQVQNYESEYYPDHSCFNAVSYRGNSRREIIYCNIDVEANDRYSRPYDARKVQFLMRKNGAM